MARKFHILIANQMDGSIVSPAFSEPLQNLFYQYHIVQSDRESDRESDKESVYIIHVATSHIFHEQ